MYCVAVYFNVRDSESEEEEGLAYKNLRIKRKCLRDESNPLEIPNKT